MRNIIRPMELKNFYIIKTRETAFPLHIHYGIYYEGRIYHNPRKHGRPVIETLDGFLDEGKMQIDCVFPFLLNGITVSEFMSVFNAVKEKGYSYLFYNCEDFVNDFIGKYRFWGGKFAFISSIILFFSAITYIFYLIF